MSSSNPSHILTHARSQERPHLPLPSPTPSRLSQRIHAFLIPLHHVCLTWCQQLVPFAPEFFSSFYARLTCIHPQPQNRSARTGSASLPLNPAIQRLSNMRMEQEAAQADQAEALSQAQDLDMRTDSLLHTAFKVAEERSQQGQQDDLAASFATLRALLNWRGASISQYGACITDKDPTIVQALVEWEQCDEALQVACNQDKRGGDAHHAESYYQAIQALSLSHAGPVRYAGAFGKKQNLLQATLKKFYTSCLKDKPLPDCIKDGLERGAIDSVEDLVSYGIDLLWQHMLQENPHLIVPSEKIGDALELLKPCLPDLKRRAPRLLASLMPACFKETVNETLQQGLFSLFLDLLPDSLIRDQCVDLVNILGEGAHAEDLSDVLLEWKQRFIHKAVSFLPTSALDGFNEEMEKTFNTFLHGFNDILDGLGPGLQQRMNETLFSYGTYLLEWEYDTESKTYSVIIYASGSSLNVSHYPRDWEGNPLWPICLNGISLTPALLCALKKMSAATAITKGWKRTPSSESPLTHAELFGPDGLIPLLQSMGAQLDQNASAALPSLSKMLSEADMVSLYCHPNQSPDAVRYTLLRQALLKACAPFGHVSIEGEPPSLKIPEGKDGALLLDLLQSATRALQAHAQKAAVAPEGLREIQAFEQQLMLAKQARQQATQTVQISQGASRLKSASNPAVDPSEEELEALEQDKEESLGMLLDTLLTRWCRIYGEVHPLEKYRSLLLFALGKHSERLVERLCRRARTLQLRAQQAAVNRVHSDIAPTTSSQAEPTLLSPLTAMLSPPQAPPSHRKRGPVGQVLYDPMMVTFLEVFYCIGQLQLALSYGWKSLSFDVIPIIKSSALSVVQSKIFPTPIQDQLKTLYLQLTILYEKLCDYVTDALRDFVFALLFPYLEGSETITQLREQIAPFLSALPDISVPQTLPVALPPPPPIHLPLQPKDELLYRAPGQASSSTTIDVESHFFYAAQDRCYQLDQLSQGIDDASPFIRLPSILSNWKYHCQGLPHLLIHHIHTLPILPTSNQFACFFLRKSNYPPQVREEWIQRILFELDALGEYLDSCMTQSCYAISWREYQLAQYHLLAFTDLLIRQQLPDHPFGNLQIDADALIQEWSEDWSDASAFLIHTESREHARTVLQYFYPGLSLEALLENPPSNVQREQWQKMRWFSGIRGCFQASSHGTRQEQMRVLHQKIATLDSPEIRYYQECFERADSCILYEKEGKQFSLLPKSYYENIFDLFCLAHTNSEELQHFNTPLHWTVPLLARQADRALYLKQVISFHFTDQQSLTKKFEITQRFIPVDPQEREPEYDADNPSTIWNICGNLLHAASMYQKAIAHSMDALVILPSDVEPSVPQHVLREFPKQEPTLSNPEMNWNNTEQEQFCKQECRAVYMKKRMTHSEEPTHSRELLTGPSRALRLLAEHPNCSENNFSIIWKLLLSTGHLEIDLQENPALIHNYAQSMRAAFYATKNLDVMLRICALTLAIRSRAWSVRVYTPAFTFLEEAVAKLSELAGSDWSRWHTLCIQTLYHDHPDPKTLSQEQQQYTISLLLSTLNVFKDPNGSDSTLKFFESPNGVRSYAYYAALQHMGLRWYRCMQYYQFDSLPAIQSTHVTTLSAENTCAKQWQGLMKFHGVTELILQGETPITSTWMVATPLDAHIYRRMGDVVYTLLTDPHECTLLLQSLSNVFHWIQPLQPQALSPQKGNANQELAPEHRVQCWMYRESLFKNTILVTQGQAQWIFKLESFDHKHRLLGMLEEDGAQLVYPASAAQVQQWCAPWAHFAPLSSMVLLVDRHTQRPVRCLMTSLNLDFSFEEMPDGTWRGANSQLYPGYWIAGQQTMPFGLILENQEKEQQLLLPAETLPHQALYTQIAPVFGILGSAVQRHKLFHTTGSVHSYHYTNQQWTSTDPFAMVHLLLLYFASQNTEAMRLTGDTLLRMPLPESLEMELLPLHISRNRKVRKLHAHLLAQIETSLLAVIPTPLKSGLIGKYLPAPTAKLLSLITVYRSLACERSDDLSDATVHTLFARYRRQLHANQKMLIELFAYEEALQLLSIDWLALHLLPKNVQERVIHEERQIGNGLHPIDYSLRFTREWQAADPLFSSPWMQRAYTVKQLLQAPQSSASQSSIPSLKSSLISAVSLPMISAVGSPLTESQSSMPWQTLQSHGRATCIRYLTQLKTSPIEALPYGTLLEWNARIEHELIPTLTPGTLSQETLVPCFLTYQAMAQGAFGKHMQDRLIQQLYLFQWTLSPGPQKTLAHILLTIATNPHQYAVFNRLYNPKGSLHRLLIEQQEERNAEKRAERCEDERLRADTDLFLIERTRNEQKEKRQRNQSQRELALIEQWQLLARYHNVQARWTQIGNISRQGIQLFGAYYVLPTLSETLVNRAVCATTQRLASLPPPSSLSTALPHLSIGLAAAAGLAGYCFYRNHTRKGALKQSLHLAHPLLPQFRAPAPKKLPAPFKTFNRLTGLSVTPQALTSLGTTTLTVVGTRVLSQYASQHLLPSLVNRATALAPSTQQPPTQRQCFLAAISLVTSVYMLNRMYRTRKKRALRRNQIKGSMKETAASKATKTIGYNVLSTMTIFGTRCAIQYAHQNVLPSLARRAGALVPASVNTPNTRRNLLACIPVITGLYSLYRIYHIHQKITGRHKATLALKAPTAPCLSRACQNALHREDQRWKEFLDLLFSAHFVAKTLDRVPVNMEDKAASTLQNSLTHYNNQAGALRTLYFLRSPETLADLSAKIDSELTLLTQRQKQDSRELFKALKVPKETQAELMEGFRRFFAVQEVGVLNTFGITDEEKLQLQEILPPFFLRETEIQQLRRIAKALGRLQACKQPIDSKEWEALCEQLITDMQARRMYDLGTVTSQRLSFFLAFESSTGKLLWKQQVETLSKVLDAGDKSVAYELLMSLGKTFFAIPMTALSYADGAHIVFMIWPEAMYATQTRETGEQFFLLSGRPVTPLKINRSFALTPERLDALLRLFKDMQNRKGAISTCKRDLQSLELLTIEQLLKFENKFYVELSSQEKIRLEKLQRLALILIEYGIYIGDESHELFQDIVLHFPVGPKTRIPPHEAHAARKVMEELLRSELGNILRIYTRLDAKNESTALFEQERTRIARRIVEGTLCGKIDPEHQSGVFHYLLDKSKMTPQWLLDPARCKMRDKVDAARGVLLVLFPLFFSRSVDGDFGRSKIQPNLMHVIPYDGHDHPADNKRIAQSHEAQAKSLVNYWHHQLQVEDFKRLLQACDANSRKWEQKKHKPYAESPDACAFAALFAQDAHTLTQARQYINQPEALAKLLQDVQDPVNLLLLFSRCCVEPSLECQEAQISSSPHDFHSMFQRGTVCTGTAYNEAIYPLKMQRQLNETTLGEAITHIKNKCPPGGILSLTQMEPRALLYEVIFKCFLSDKQATALMDVEGRLTGLSHAEVARILLTEVSRQRPGIEVVDYFDLDPTTGEEICMSLLVGAAHPIPKHACQISLEKRIAFFDQSHCFAANILQAANGKGVLLLRSGYQLYKALQAAFRMRYLKKYKEYMGLQQNDAAMHAAVQDIWQKDLIATQTLYIALDPQMSSSLPNEANHAQQLDHIFYAGEEQQGRSMQMVHLRGGLSLLRTAHRKAVWHALLKGPTSQMLNHFHHARALLVTLTPQRASHLYGGARINVTGKQLVQRHYDQACARVDANPMLSKKQRQDAKAELTEIFQKVMQLPLPDEIPIKVDQEGGYVLDADQAGQEVEVEQEAEAEAEAERAREQARETETENEREIQRQLEFQAGVQPLAIMPKPWDKACPLDSSKWQWIEFNKTRDDTLTQVKTGIKAIQQLRKANHPKQQTPCTPPLYTLQHLFEHAADKILNDLSTSIDPRIWWSNHLLPQLHLPFGANPAQPATGAQHNITHLLIEVQPEKGQTPARILSVGCLGETDATYWIKRLQSEHRHRANNDTPKNLFLIYQMPILENLDPNEQYDSTVIAFNQDHTFNLQKSQDFERLETMIKLCNGDKRYTPEQCARLREWKQQYSSSNALTLHRAFALFRMMAQERSNGTQTFCSLSEIIDPLDEEG